MKIYYNLKNYNDWRKLKKMFNCHPDLVNIKLAVWTDDSVIVFNEYKHTPEVNTPVMIHNSCLPTVLTGPSSFHHSTSSSFSDKRSGIHKSRPIGIPSTSWCTPLRRQRSNPEGLPSVCHFDYFTIKHRILPEAIWIKLTTSTGQASTYVSKRIKNNYIYATD